MQSIMEWSLTLTCDAIQSHIGQTYLTPIYNKANYLPRSQTKTLSKPEARAYYGYTSYNTNVCLFVIRAPALLGLLYYCAQCMIAESDEVRLYTCLHFFH